MEAKLQVKNMLSCHHCQLRASSEAKTGSETQILEKGEVGLVQGLLACQLFSLWHIKLGGFSEAVEDHKVIF